MFKAKKNAEASEGVGKETELLVLTEDGIQQLSNDDLSVLTTIYRDCRITQKIHPISVHFFMNSRIFQKKSNFFTKKSKLAHYLPQYSLIHLTF